MSLAQWQATQSIEYGVEPTQNKDEKHFPKYLLNFLSAFIKKLLNMGRKFQCLPGPTPS